MHLTNSELQLIIKSLRQMETLLNRPEGRKSRIPVCQALREKFERELAKELELLQGLLDLTRIVLERIFIKDKVAKLTNEHLAVLSDIVFHHLFKLPSRENIVLDEFFGVCTGKPKTLDDIKDEIGVPLEYLRQTKRKALIELTQAAQSDLIKTMDDIEDEREQA